MSEENHCNDLGAVSGSFYGKFRAMKALYNKVKKKQQELRLLSAYLDSLIEERWGFNYSQTDHDRIIDTLDYGTDDLNYKTFVQIMDKLKKEVDSGERDLNP